jgi:hypothetical protein
MIRAGWSVVMVLVACGDNAFDDRAHSGTRLRVEWNKAEDGAQVATGRIYDRERQEFCSQEAWSDGVTRCTRTEGYVGYSDPQCTRPVIVAGVEGEVANDFDVASCSQKTAWVAGTVSATTTWYEASTTGCMGPFTVDPMLPLRVAQKQIDPDHFVVLATSGPRGDGRLQSVDYTTADGLRIVKETRDTELATVCYPSATGCDPVAAYEVDYLDAACTQPIAGIFRTACSPPEKYAAILDPVCSTKVRFRAIGGIVASDHIYQLSAGTCAAITASADHEYHSLGAEITPAAMAPAVEAAPGRRLQPMYYAGEGIAAPSGQLFDSQVGVPCAWQAATDGATRCLPVSAQIYTYLYADASCTQPVTVTFLPTAECATAPPPQFATSYLAPGNEVHLVLGRRPGPLYQRGGTDCSLGTFSGYDAYDVDPGVADPASFEMSELVLEP